MDAEEKLIHQAKKAEKSGNHRAARRIILTVIMENPMNEEAWFFLSEVADNLKLRRACLEQVLDINPNNKDARLQLSKIDGKKPLDSWKFENVYDVV